MHISKHWRNLWRLKSFFREKNGITYSKRWKLLDLLYLQCRIRNEWYHPWIFRSSWTPRRFYLTGCCWQRSHCYFRCRGWRTCRPRKWSWHVAARGLCNQKGHFQNQPEIREKNSWKRFFFFYFFVKILFFCQFTWSSLWALPILQGTSKSKTLSSKGWEFTFGTKITRAAIL